MKGVGADLHMSMFCHERRSIALLKVLFPKHTLFPSVSQTYSHFLTFLSLALSHKNSIGRFLNDRVESWDLLGRHRVVEPPHFASGLAGEATISENKNRFSRLMQSSPRVPSTLQLPAAESIDDTVYCLFSMHKPFQNRSLSLVYVSCHWKLFKAWNRSGKHFDVNKLALKVYNTIVTLS